MEQEEINVIMSADDNFSQHLGISLFSLLENYRGDINKLIIHIIDGGISQKNKDFLEEVASSKQSKINFHVIDKNIFNDFPEIGHLKLPAYYRLLIPEIIDPHIEKVIYLDCDTIIFGDISVIFRQDLNNYTIGAVIEISQNEVLSIWRKYGLTKYFNSGVILINLAKWRKEDATKKAFDFIIENKEEIRWADQDALNFIFSNKWLELDKKFNLQIDRNQKKVKNISPIVIHYVGRLKPWHFLYQNYYSKYYWMYLRKTPWKNYRCPDFNYYDLFKKIVKKIPGTIFLSQKIIKWLKN